MPESTFEPFSFIRSFLVRVCFSCVAGLLILLAPTEAQADQPPRFELNDGDRIVLVGDTLIERDQRYGYFETLLSISNPDKNLVFRNLGWSGDTVAGISRSGFDPPDAGFEQLRQQILAARPTVVVVGYGMADSFAGEAGVPAFEQGMRRLLNVIDSTKARVIFLSPIAHAKLGQPLPDPTSHNRDLERYRDVIERIAKERSAPFVDLFGAFDMMFSASLQPKAKPYVPLTDNGINLTEDGYWGAALCISKAIAQDRWATCSLLLGPDGTIKSEGMSKVSHAEKTAGGLRFEMIDDVLPLPFPGPPSPLPEQLLFPRLLAIEDPAPGKYELKIDGKSVIIADSAEWKEGIVLRKGPELEQAKALRAAINRKNDLFFYRWRPQNITYLLGFRKHEQGNNAVEIARFDPLVAEQEKLIARLKKPVLHTYELSRVEKGVSR
jgi:lysophospholipase L1-like esterase